MEGVSGRYADTDSMFIHCRGFRREEAFAETNIRFGCYYWACCLERYGDDVSTAAASYFSGWTTVDTLLQSEEYSGDGITLHTFPYDGMEQYVEKIQKNYQAYQKLYGETKGCRA